MKGTRRLTDGAQEIAAGDITEKSEILPTPDDRESLIAGLLQQSIYDRTRQRREYSGRDRDAPSSSSRIPIEGSETISRFITAATVEHRQYRSGIKGKSRLTSDVVGMILILQQRKSVETNHLIGNSSAAELIADCFRHHHDNLSRCAVSTPYCENVGRGKKRLTIVGRIYVNAPVSSNMITTTVTVILVIPLPVSSRYQH